MALARSLLHDGADLIDIGGESGVTNRPAGERRGGDRACGAADRARGRRARRPRLGGHLQAGGGPRGDRRRSLDRQRRQRAARSRAGRRVRADRGRTGAHAHHRPAQGEAAGSQPRRADRGRRAAVPGRADRAGGVAGRRLRADHDRPGPGLLQDPGADGGGAPGAAGAARAGAADPARGQPQGLRRRADRPRAAGPAGGDAGGDGPRGGRGRARPAHPRRRRRGGLPRRDGGAARRRAASTPGCGSRTACAGTSPCPTPQHARFRFTNRRSLAQRDRSPPMPSQRSSYVRPRSQCPGSEPPGRPPRDRLRAIHRRLPPSAPRGAGRRHSQQAGGPRW